jgi:exopolysaccharide production protein ExoZ
MRVSPSITQIYEVAAGRRISAMEGIRGFAVLLVFFVHFDQLIAVNLPPGSISHQVLHWVGLMGHSGVDLFFLLSGYLIYKMIQSGTKTIWDFLARRAQRIYPTFLFVLAGYLACGFLVPSMLKVPAGKAGIAYVTANALLLPGLFAIVPIITVAWSLSYEAFYYLALPVFCWLTNVREWSRTARVWVFLGLAAAYCVFSTTCWGVSLPALALKPAQHVRLIMFVAGILVYEATAVPALQTRVTARIEIAIAMLVAVTLLAIPAIGNGISFTVPAVMLFVAFSPLCYCCLSRPEGILSTIFSFTPLRWLGNMSYSYYLIHGAILHIPRYLITHFGRPTEPFVWTALPISFAVTWAGATALFVLVEKPLSLAGGRQKSRQLAALPVPETTTASD